MELLENLLEAKGRKSGSGKVGNFQEEKAVKVNKTKGRKFGRRNVDKWKF